MELFNSDWRCPDNKCNDPTGYYERERLLQSETCEHTYAENSTVCTKCGT